MIFWKKIKGIITKITKPEFLEGFRKWFVLVVEFGVLVAIVYYAYETNKLRVATDSLVKVAIEEIRESEKTREESKKTRIATEEYTRATKELLEVQRDYTDETHRMRLNAEREIDERERQFGLSIEPQLYGVVSPLTDINHGKYLKWYTDTIDGSYKEGKTVHEISAEELSGGVKYYVTVFNPTRNNAMNVLAFSYEPSDRVFYGSSYFVNYIQPNQNYYFLITKQVFSRADLIEKLRNFYGYEETKSLITYPHISIEEDVPYLLIIYKDLQGNLFLNRTFWIYSTTADAILNKQTEIWRVSR